MARKRVRTVDSSHESNETSEKVEVKGTCPHVGKGIDIGSLKKAWKKRDDFGCQMCRKRINPTHKKGNQQSEREMWICMKCGNIGCSSSLYNHGYEHFNTRRSDCHAVVAVVDSWTLRCLQCPTDINLDMNMKAFDAVEYLKRNYFEVLKEERTEIEEVATQAVESKKHEKAPVAQEYKKLPANIEGHHALPVLGLENIGNTCYMNAVLQSLAQTPGFISELESVSQIGRQFSLPGGENLISKEHGGYVPPFEGKLGETGQLTKAVIKLLNRVRNGRQLRKTGTTNENPGDVLRLMKKLSNTFYIGEQHDSHELLRLLLEGLRAEDLKRYQRGILLGLGICNPGKVITVKEREQLIAYKKQAMQNELAVDKIFNGSLVSILTCLECGLITTNFENFMDISLPVESEKPKVFHVERSVITTESKPSKHQLKKERKLARRGKKKNKGGRVVQESNCPLAEANKNHSSSESASDSEADVEDNLDSENTTNSNQEDVVKNENEFEKNKETNNKFSEEKYSSEVSDDCNKEIPESTTYQLDNDWSVVFGCSQDPSVTVYSSSPEAGAVAYGCSPEPGAVLYGCSPEPRTVMHGCSPEPFLSEDFDSCEGGRGSPASSIEQADWDDKGNGRSDISVLTRGVDNDFIINDDTCPPPEPFELSEEDNVIGHWGEVSREELMSSDSQLDMFSLKVNPSCSEILEGKKEKFDESFNNLDDINLGKSDDSYDKQEVCRDKYNDLDANQKVVDDEVTNKLAVLDMNNIESDGNIWSTTLAPLPEIDEKVYSVYNCLNQFFSKEVLCESNQIGCRKCTKLKNGQEPKPNAKLVQANALKQLLFLKLPKILTLHFKRFEVFRSRMCKITRKVSFPLFLDISPYTSNKTLSTQPGNPAKYELYAVVEHSGHMTSGHYVAYISVNIDLNENTKKPSTADENKDNISGETEIKDNNSIKTNSCQMMITNSSKKWYFISDTHVREVTFKEVADAEAYLLFYRRLS